MRNQKLKIKITSSGLEVKLFLHGWLLDSMIPSIADLLNFETSCKEEWEAAYKRHSKKEDESKIYELVSSTYGINQVQNSVLVYANELVAIWNELDHYRPPNPSSIDQGYILRDRAYLFLLGLNSVFENFRGQIFNRPSKVSLEDVITLAIQEESRLKLQNRLPQGPDQRSNSAFVGQSHDKRVQPNSQLKRAWKSQTPYQKDSLWCNHCKKKRHTKQTCWDIHGRPNKFGKSLVTYEESGQEICQAPTQAPDMHQLSERLSYNLNELEHIKEFINSLSKNNSTSIQDLVVMANLGKCLHLKNFINSSHDQSILWIVDSGATDHMTCNSNHFITYSPCASNRKVQSADGSMLTVESIGRVKIDIFGILEDVLHIPKLCINLVSVQKLAKLPKYSIIFDNDECFLIHKWLNQKIGLARIFKGTVPASRDRDNYMSKGSSQQKKVLISHVKLSSYA